MSSLKRLMNQKNNKKEAVLYRVLIQKVQIAQQENIIREMCNKKKKRIVLHNVAFVI